MRTICLVLATATLSILFPAIAGAWDNHALGTRLAVEMMPEVKDAPAVKAETLDEFLAATHWGDRASFLAVLRVNPTVKLAMFLRRTPGAPTDDGRETLALDAVDLLPSQLARGVVFEAISPGDMISALDVLTSAADEPDYGLDINLFEDSGTPFGAQYGFGKQPFGNPKQELSTQAPFHMGFFHESKLVYAAASFLEKTHVEYRLKQYVALSRMAFARGHPYWGWRFAGWALHYVQDLTQPYHARVLPGVSTAKMLAINLLDLVGVHNPKDDRVQLVSNRHLALENYQGAILTRILANNDRSDAVARALADQTGDAALGPFDLEETLRNCVSKDASDLAARVDRAVTAALPRQIVSDPSYVFGVTDPLVNALALVESGPAKPRQELEALLAQVMRNFGAHTRNLLRLILSH